MPRCAITATSVSRRVFRSSFPVLLPGFQIWERKYSSPYLLKTSLPSVGVADVWVGMERIITDDLASADLTFITPGATSVETMYSPAGSIEAPTWNPNGTRTVKFCDPCAYTDAAASRATLKLRIN